MIGGASVKKYWPRGGKMKYPSAIELAADGGFHEAIKKPKGL